jgi:predicted nuclease of predicted toxin-antitoxin system
MKIKLDHNISRHLKDTLEKFGHDVDTAFDEGLAGVTDKELLHEASNQRSVYDISLNQHCRWQEHL